MDRLVSSDHILYFVIIRFLQSLFFTMIRDVVLDFLLQLISSPPKKNLSSYFSLFLTAFPLFCCFVCVVVGFCFWVGSVLFFFFDYGVFVLGLCNAHFLFCSIWFGMGNIFFPERNLEFLMLSSFILFLEFFTFSN